MALRPLTARRVPQAEPGPLVALRAMEVSGALAIATGGPWGPCGATAQGAVSRLPLAVSAFAWAGSDVDRRRAVLGEVGRLARRAYALAEDTP